MSRPTGRPTVFPIVSNMRRWRRLHRTPSIIAQRPGRTALRGRDGSLNDHPTTRRQGDGRQGDGRRATGDGRRATGDGGRATGDGRQGDMATGRQSDKATVGRMTDVLYISLTGVHLQTACGLRTRHSLRCTAMVYRLYGVYRYCIEIRRVGAWATHPVGRATKLI